MKITLKKLTQYSCILAMFIFSASNAQTWTGLGGDTNWSNDLNWDTPFAPSLPLTVGVVIGTGPNQPVITSDFTVSGGTISVQNGAQLQFNPNVTLVNNGVIIVLSGGLVTFKSDATGSAYIGDSSTGFFSGDFTIERYIPAKRAFRLLSTPVTTTDHIDDNWQQNTHITGVGGGFDLTETTNPSMFTHNISSVDGSWDPILNTDATTLTAGTPYLIMVRGDRTTNLSSNSATPSATTLISSGTLTYEGNTTFSPTLNANANGYSLIGNPYQAPVNMNTVLAAGSNVNALDYWVWDQNLNTRGAYTTVTVSTGTATGGSDANEFLQPGQGAFIQTAAAGVPSITFTQASKDVSESQTAVFKTSGKTESNPSVLSLNLYESGALAENKTAADGILIMFGSEYSNDVDLFDASKFTNLDENFSTSNEGELLSIERRGIPTVSDEIKLDITTYRNTNYTIVAEGTSLSGDTPVLVDTYTNTSTEIPENGTVNYSYTVDENNSASIAADRFKINFISKALSVSDVDIEQIQIFPNPVNGGDVYLNIPKNMDDLEVGIYNALGVQLFSKSDFSAGNKATINTSFAKNKGVYFVKLTSKGRSVTKKLMIN